MSLKTETLLISAILRQEDSISPVLAGVEKKWFAACGDQWEWIERYISRHRKTPSKTLFRSKFPDFQLVQSDDVEYCIGELRDEYLVRSFVAMVDDSLDAIKDGRDIESIINSCQSNIVKLQGDALGNSNESSIIDDWEPIYNEVSRRYERANERGISGIPTGFSTLDKVTSGPQPGDYWIVAARLGQGKTWALIRMATMAVYQGHTVQYDALEQSRAQIAMRAHSFLSASSTKEGIRSSALISGKGFDLAAYKRFLSGLRNGELGNFVVNDTSRGRVSPGSIAAQIERNRPDVVYIDYLTLMNSQAGDWQAIAALSSELKGIAMRYEVPIVAAAQINRMAIGSDVPGAEHLAGADAIGQDADCVVTMRQVSRRVTKMKLAKYRHGQDGMEWFNEFRPGVGVFREISGDIASDLISEDKLEDMQKP